MMVNISNARIARLSVQLTGGVVAIDHARCVA